MAAREGLSRGTAESSGSIPRSAHLVSVGSIASGCAIPSAVVTPPTHQAGPFPQTPAVPGVIDFGLGQPSPSLLPLAAIARAAGERLGGDADPLVLQYGTRRGHLGFREALAELLSREYGHAVSAHQLAVTGGTSLALSMVSQVFARPGSVVVCSDPTYFLAAGIFATQHLEVVGVPTDHGGLDVEALARRLRAGLRPAFVYCIPSFHNPCGVTLHAERARRLIELAERHDFVVVADEPYPLLHFGEPPPCMMSFDEGRGRVLSLGSLSKILAPGLRLGWAHGEPPLINRLIDHGSLRSGGCQNPVIASVVHGTIESGFLVEHLAHLRRVLGERAGALVRALSERLELDVSRPGGGYFVWLDLGDGLDTTELLALSRAEYDVRFTPGARCAVERDLRGCLRLCFAFYEVVELELGVERLARALAHHRRTR